MRVIDHHPHFWFLFQEGGSLLLDVNCDHGAVGYSVLISLNAEEESEYARSGHSFLNGLAQAVQDSGPGGSYQSRDVSATYAKDTLAAFREWRAASGNSQN